MGELYAFNLSTDSGTPAAQNPNDWDESDGWHISPSGVYVSWYFTLDLYIAVGGTAVIGNFAALGYTNVVGDGCRIGAFASWASDEAGSVMLGEGCRIGEHTTFGGGSCTLGDDVKVGRWVTIGHAATIGDDVDVRSDWTIGDDCVIGAGTTIGAA